MDITPKHQDISLFSASATEKQVELKFANRLFNYVEGLTVRDIHRLVNSGEFNEIFPALDDEISPVAPRRFEDLKPFDYRAWAKRNQIKD